MIDFGKDQILAHFDTFGTRASGASNKGEERRFAQLYRNEADHNTVHLRMPKLQPGEAIDKDALRDFAQELCEKIKEKIEAEKRVDFKGKEKLVEIFRAKKPKKEPDKTEE